MKVFVGLLAGISVALAGCGGGGGGGTNPPVSLSLTGVAATGLAIPSANVSVKCQTGTGTATTNASGSYSVAISGGVLPCMLEVTNSSLRDRTKLHSVVAGSSNSAVANITPLTELVTSRLLGQDSTAYFAGLSATNLATKITIAAISASQADVVAVLAGAVDTAAISNLISTPMVAATATSPSGGDAQDRILDTVRLKFSNVQLAQLGTSLASTQTVAAVRSSLPPASLLTYVTPKSGLYRGFFQGMNDTSLIGVAYISADGKLIGTDNSQTRPSLVSSMILSIDSTGKITTSTVQVENTGYYLNGSAIQNAEVSSGSVVSADSIKLNLNYYDALRFSNSVHQLYLVYDPVLEGLTPSSASIAGDYSDYSSSSIFYSWNISLRISSNGSITGKRKTRTGTNCTFTGQIDSQVLNQTGPNFASLSMTACDDQANVRAVLATTGNKIFLGVLPDSSVPAAITAFEVSKSVLPSPCSPSDHPYCL